MTECCSDHYAQERYTRETFIEEHIGEGNVVDTFVVDRGHRNGEEIHSVTDTGVIIVRNRLTGKLITKLIARPEQLRRLYALRNLTPPKKLLRLSYKNNSKNFNNM